MISTFTTAEMDALRATLDKPVSAQAAALARTGFELDNCIEAIGKAVAIEAVPDPDPREAVRLLRDPRQKLRTERLAQIESGDPLTSRELEIWRDLRLEEIGLDEQETRWPYLSYCVAYDCEGREIYIATSVTDWHLDEPHYELAGLFATSREAERYCPAGAWIA